MTWQFHAVLDRTPTDAAIDALFETGLDFDVVEGATLTGAVIEVVQAVLRTTGMHVVGLDSGDAVTLGEAANRLGGARTQASLRQLSTGERGPGGFPQPLATSGGKVTLYSYAE